MGSQSGAISTADALLVKVAGPFTRSVFVDWRFKKTPISFGKRNSVAIVIPNIWTVIGLVPGTKNMSLHPGHSMPRRRHFEWTDRHIVGRTIYKFIYILYRYSIVTCDHWVDKCFPGEAGSTEVKFAGRMFLNDALKGEETASSSRVPVEAFLVFWGITTRYLLWSSSIRPESSPEGRHITIFIWFAIRYFDYLAFYSFGFSFKFFGILKFV